MSVKQCKRTLRSSTLLVVFLLTTVNSSVYSQDAPRIKNPVTFLKSHDGIVYINNTEGAFFTIDCKGDTLINAGINNGFKVDSTIFQAILNPYEETEYNLRRSDSTQEIAVLKSKMDWELNYISGEVFKRNVKSGHEVFKNKDGKNYFLWHYISPIGERKNPDDILVVEQYFLTFVSNRYVAGISTPLFENESSEEKISMLKALADRIDVFGGKVDLDWLYYKLGARAVGKNLQYDDSTNGFVLSVPEWFNIVESPNPDVFLGTFPDVGNVKNAVMVQKFKKSEFKSFKKFNEQVIPDNKKPGSQMSAGIFLERMDLPKPTNVNGVSTRILVENFTGRYIIHYLTVETAHSYLKIMFTATPGTFEMNHPRFLAFVEAIDIIK